MNLSANLVQVGNVGIAAQAAYKETSCTVPPIANKYRTMIFVQSMEEHLVVTEIMKILECIPGIVRLTGKAPSEPRRVTPPQTKVRFTSQ
jgi:hypothetical protein